jgi:excisionase family DNA binding protein
MTSPVPRRDLRSSASETQGLDSVQPAPWQPDNSAPADLGAARLSTGQVGPGGRLNNDATPPALDDDTAPLAEWLTKQEAAQYLGVTPKTIQRWIAQGKLSVFRDGGILRIHRRDLNSFVQDTVDDLKGDLEAQARRSGIQQIFASRHEDPAYKAAILHALKAEPRGTTVRMMSVSLTDFFGPMSHLEYLLEILSLLQRDAKIQVLLLDPTCAAARERAVVEQEDVVRTQGFTSSSLFRQVKAVLQRLADPAGSWELDQPMVDRFARQVELRLYPFEPTTHLIQTSTATFLENYHRGRSDRISAKLNEKGMQGIRCWGGFVPTFSLSPLSRYAEFLSSHFENAWEVSAPPDDRPSGWKTWLQSFENAQRDR